MTETSAQRRRIESPLPTDFRVEPWGDRPDYGLITELLNRAMIADGIDHHATESEMENFYSKLPQFSPQEDAFITWVGDKPIGWVGLQPRQEVKGDLILRHHIALLPEWRGQGIRAELINLIEQRAADRTAGAPPDQTAWLEVSYSSGQSDAIELIEEKGYHPTRYFFFMTRPLDQPIVDQPLPAGFHVRPITEADYRPVWEAHHQAFSEHWGHPEQTEEHFQMFIDDPLADPSLWQVAWHGDEVAGMVLNFMDKQENQEFNRQRGYTEEIAVVRPYRGQGLATALIAKSMRMFKEMGMTETALSVDTENASGALKLYQKLGYQTDRKSTAYRKKLN